MPLMKKADIILISSILTAALAIFVFQNIPRGPSVPYAVITADGGFSRRVSLTEDTEFIINRDGMTNTITVENNTIRISHANCPNSLCVRQGAISKKNQVVVCIPNKLMIEIRSGAEEAEYDAVSG